MKTTLALTLTLILPFLLFSQKNQKEEFYAFDKEFRSISNADSSAYLMRIMKVSDSVWQWDTYNTYGPLVAVEQFRDHDGKMPNGHFTYYHASGYRDSTGFKLDGVLHGDWTYFNDTGRAIFVKKYDAGKLSGIRDLSEEEKKKAELSEKATDKEDRDEKESEFKGGIGRWQRYLQSNLQYPERAQSLKKTGVIWIEFIVDTRGKVMNAGIIKSVEYSLDQEALRIIRESPNWEPAIQDGRLVKSYKRQPIHFRL